MIETILVIGDGEVLALAGGPVPIGDLGPRVTRRVSHIEFNTHSNKWEVTEGQSGQRRLLFSSPDYDACLQWETSHYNQQLKHGINLIPNHP